MDHGVDVPQGMAERKVVGEIAEGDLDAYALGAQAPRVPDQAPDRHPRGGEASQQRQADGSGGAGQQKHGEGG